MTSLLNDVHQQTHERRDVQYFGDCYRYHLINTLDKSTSLNKLAGTTQHSDIMSPINVNNNTLTNNILSKNGTHLSKQSRNQPSSKLLLNGVENDIQITPMITEGVGNDWSAQNSHQNYHQNSHQSSTCMDIYNSVISTVESYPSDSDSDSDSDAGDFDVTRKLIMLRADEHSGFWGQILQVICAVFAAGTIEIGTGQMLATARVNI